MKQHDGFTLIELMVVMLIIGILAAAAIPAYTDYLKRSKIAESLQLVSEIQKNIVEYYAWYGVVPANNQALNLPPPESLRGSYTQSIEVEQGALHVKYFKGTTESARILSLRLALLENYPAGAVIMWVCGYAEPLPDFYTLGENRTDLEPAYLPDSCQKVF